MIAPADFAMHLVHAYAVRPLREDDVSQLVRDRLVDDDGTGALLAFVVAGEPVFYGPRVVVFQALDAVRAGLARQLEQAFALPPAELGSPFRVVSSIEAHVVIDRLAQEPRAAISEDTAVLLDLLRHRDHLAAQVTELQRAATARVEARRLVAATLAGVIAGLSNRDESDDPHGHPADAPLSEAWKEGLAVGRAGRARLDLTNGGAV